ncbi:secreted protein, partial [sediment metagenome]
MSSQSRLRPFVTALLALGVLLTWTERLTADSTNPPPDPRALHKQIVADWYARDGALARTRPHLWVRPGLVADRGTRRVRVYGESTSLNLGDPVEFPLIAEQSGKDYEALAVSFAQPSDVHRALEFIGLRPGAATSPSGLRFWPRGERVRVTFDLIATNGAATPICRAESLVTDTRTDAPLPETGFVFCGARWTHGTDDTSPATGLVYAADVF